MQLRTCRTLDDLIAILRERRDELNLTNETLEAVSGIADGYSPKILSASPTRRLGPMSFSALLGVLALKIGTVTIEHDEVAAAVLAPRWKPRRGRPRRQRDRKKAAARKAKAKAKPKAAAAPKPAPSTVRCCNVQYVLDFAATKEVDDMKLIGARCDEKLAQQVEAAAAKERRPVAAFVRNVLTDAVKPQPGEAATSAPKSADEVAA